MDLKHNPWRSPGSGAEWREQYCTCATCRADRWMVRADPRAAELWQVAEDAEGAAWTIAATEPSCPLCGEPLAAHREGLGDPEGKVDNAFVAYIRALKQAA